MLMLRVGEYLKGHNQFLVVIFYTSLSTSFYARKKTYRPLIKFLKTFNLN